MVKLNEPLSLERIRKDMCRISLVELFYETGIDKSGLCKFRKGATGLNCINLLKLINFLYYDNKTESSL